VGFLPKEKGVNDMKRPFPSGVGPFSPTTGGKRFVGPPAEDGVDKLVNADAYLKQVMLASVQEFLEGHGPP
jgi:hypothetical protein